MELGVYFVWFERERVYFERLFGVEWFRIENLKSDYIPVIGFIFLIFLIHKGL